jgi:hypothetical protein
MLLKPAVESATTQAERFGGLADIPAVTIQGLPNEHLLDFVQRHVVEGCGRTYLPKTEVTGADVRIGRQQGGALDSVIQLPHVPRPGMCQECTQRFRLEVHERLAIPRCMTPEEMVSEGADILAALPERREVDLYRVQSKEQVLPKASRGHFGA